MEVSAPPIDEQWNLTDIFDDDDAFQAARKAFGERWTPPVDRYRGVLMASASNLAETLEAVADARRRLHELHCYAALRSDGDTRVAGYQAMRQSVELLGTELGKRLSWMSPEILACGRSTLKSYLADEPRLAPYRFFLENLDRQRNHVLPAGEERVLAESGLIRGQAGSLYQLLANAELPRAEITLSSGECVRLTPVEYQRCRSSNDRADRRRVYSAYFGSYADFRGTLGLNLYASVKEHIFRSRARNYDSCLAAALDDDHVPQEVYRSLIRGVRRALPTLHRYLKLRGEFLRLGDLEYADLYCPLSGKPSMTYSPAEARRLVTDSLSPLGAQYTEPLNAAFDSRWIDWHPAEGKRSGAYATGWAYDVHPYILLNYSGDYDAVSTLTHELGHAMHSYFSNKHQPFPTADYSIFVAEVASTFNETLLVHKVLESSESDEDRLAVVVSYLDGMRGTLFRQTMFAEFELAIHERAEAGEVLTGESLSELYLELLRTYHGHDAGVMTVDDRYAVEWALVPHFYYNFYVYQYATGIVAASALARAVLADEDAARDRYMRFLGSGGSNYPLALLRSAGVDLEQPEPYRQTIAAVDAHLDTLESLLPRLARTRP